MKMLLSELRALIAEAMDPMRLIMIPDPENDACALIADDDDQERMRAGMTFAYSSDADAYEVISAWATDARAAVALFSGALVAKGHQLPDITLSPAAKAIIKRWYAKHKNDGSILPAPPRKDVENNEPAFNSIYTVPPGFTSPVPIDQVRDRDDIKQKLLKGVIDGFVTMYQDTSKTGESNFKKFLQVGDWEGLQGGLTKTLYGNNINLKTRAIEWFIDHADEIRSKRVPWKRASNWYHLADTYGLPANLWARS